MTDHIKCISCRFARVDEQASEKSWTAYECGNKNSEFYIALLNVSINGDRHKRISWSGCEHGQRGQRGGFQYDC